MSAPVPEGTEAFAAVPHADPAAVAPLWRRFQETGACTAYQRLEWAQCLVAHLCPPRRGVPLILEIRRAGDAVMLLPLVQRRHRGVRIVEALDLGVCDYAAPLLAPGFAPGAGEAAAIWRVVLRALPPCDLLRLARIPEALGPVANPLALLPEARPIALTASGVALEGDPDTLLKRVCSASFHRDLQRRAKRLDGRATVRLVVAEGEAEIAELFETLAAQRRERFREIGRHEPLDLPGTAAFYRAAALSGAETGSVRVFGLKADDAWIATAYGLVHGGAFHGTILAMAGEPWRTFAPGLLIAARIMVWARAQGLTYFDFTVGAQTYKNGFRPEARALLGLAVPLTLRGRAALALERAAEAIRNSLERRPALSDRVRRSVRWLRRRGSRAQGPTDEN
ncbi:GNAT family N-acetyltransferase [Methylobacterium sp. Leaf118]|uniref:GNAT family N-acetyltransferase n=1 Tax=Methylobacterium sp. Leaf118 TaxID=2876562 RepID=UPI001E309C2B|nr:GNAT family N-acetyltransferase [Methylobacterium sp. Leaf118]